jgi:flagellin-specific chaperone FliS
METRPKKLTLLLFDDIPSSFTLLDNSFKEGNIRDFLSKIARNLKKTAFTGCGVTRICN